MVFNRFDSKVLFNIFAFQHFCFSTFLLFIIFFSNCQTLRHYTEAAAETAPPPPEEEAPAEGEGGAEAAPAAEGEEGAEAAYEPPRCGGA